MKKVHLIFISFILILSFSFFGCKSSKSNKTVSSGSYRLAFTTSIEDTRGLASKLFKKLLEQETDHRFEIEIYPNGLLGSDSDLIRKLVDGDVDIIITSAGNLTDYVPEAGYSALPFLFENFEDAWSFIDSNEITGLYSDFEKYNIHVLANFDNGFRCVTTSKEKGPVNCVADMNNLKIRTPENKIVMDTMKALGAQPEKYSFAGLSEALKKGIFDAQENPVPVIYNNKLYNVQSYLAITNHSYDSMPFLIQNDIWQSLSEDDKILFRIAAIRAQDYDRTLVKNQTEEFIQRLIDEGMTVTYPDLLEFSSETKEIIQSYEASLDQKKLTELHKILNK